MKIGIIGTGYVGLLVGAVLASNGNVVVGYDVDHDKVEALKRGEVALHEPGLEALVQAQMDKGRLRFTHDDAEAMRFGEVLFITVPTPSLDNGAADRTQVAKVAERIGDVIDAFKVIVIKSTVPVGTTEFVESIILSRTTCDFAVVCNPEFVREGSALSDYQSPHRIIIGTQDQRARDVLARLYRPFIRDEQRTLYMDSRSAEMTKYATNAMLALRVSFMNEMAALCEAMSADIENVRLGIGSDPRIGSRFLYAGIGFGGSCFPKDIEALISMGQEYNTSVPLMRAVRLVNRGQRLRLYEKIEEHFDNQLEGMTLAVWGTTYKPNSDDIRESPAVIMLEALLARGAKIQASDPAGLTATAAYFKGEALVCLDDEYEALEGADALVIATDWPQFKTPDFQRIRESLKTPVVFDGRNLYDPSVVEEHGLLYYSIGRRCPDSMARLELGES